MNIHEHQAKELLRSFGINTPKGVYATSKDQIDHMINAFDARVYVVKAQIHAGGRGKAGGVKVVRTKEDAKKAAHDMWHQVLVTHQTKPSGQLVRRIYVEDGSDIKKEYYISAALDRVNACVTFMASSEGGVDIEEVSLRNPEKIITVNIDPVTGIQPHHCRKVAFGIGFYGNHAKQLAHIMTSMYQAFIATDADQIEINPLVETVDGTLIALDAKINFDDNGLFRHDDILNLRDKSEEEPLEIRAADASLSYIKMDGNIGCMVNGAGLAMATMDIIKLYGGNPANFLDVGGGADKDRVTEAFKIILSDTNVKAILVNIFGGIMKCDIIAEGVVAAAKDVDLKIPLVVRLSGTNFELGKQILDNSGLRIISASDLGDAAKKAVDAIN